MNLSFTQEIYVQMRINAQKGSQGIECESLKKLNVENLNLKSLCSRNFDSNLLHATFTITTGIVYSLEIVEKVNSILQFFKVQWESNHSEFEKNQSLVQLMADQTTNPSTFHKNLQNVLIQMVNFVCLPKHRYVIIYPQIEDFRRNIQWFVLQFVQETVFQSQKQQRRDKIMNLPIQQKQFYEQIYMIPELVTGAVIQSNHHILHNNPRQYLSLILDNISSLIIREQEFFKNIDLKEQQHDRSELISQNLQQSFLLIQLLSKLLTGKILLQLTSVSNNLDKINEAAQSPTPLYSDVAQLSQSSSKGSKIKSSSLIDQLNQYTFFYMQKALKYYEIGTVPVYFEFIIKIQKIQKEEFDRPIQIDMFLKNKLQKYFKDIFEVIARNINRTSLSAIVDFCSNLGGIKSLGFDILSQLNIYYSINEIHYKLNSYLLKVQQQISQMQDMKADQETMLREFFLTEEKLRYMLKSLEKVFVDSFYLEDIYTVKSSNKQYLIDKRVHQIVQLWNTFFEFKQDAFARNNQEEYSDYFEKSNLFIKSQPLIQNKNEELLIRKVSFLDIANQFLLRDKDQSGESFSSAIITELVFPKFDLCNSLQQLFMMQSSQLNKPGRRQDEQLQDETKISVLVFKRVVKRLYMFFLNLLANTKEIALREKAIKDLSKSISLLFTSDLLFDDSIKQTMFAHSNLGKKNLLEFIASKIQQNYFQCNFDEQITFLIEVLTVITQQLLKIEEDFFVSVEATKGSVESMRNNSLFRQFVQKAQGNTKKQNLQIGAILEKKVIDYKKVYHILPLLAKCCEVFSGSGYANYSNFPLKSRTASLVLELWIFIVLNNPYFMVADINNKKKNDQTNQERLTSDETKELNIILQPMKEMMFQMGQTFNNFAFVTPSLLPGQLLSFLDSRIIQLLLDNSTSYTCHNFYMRCLTQQVKALFSLKKKAFENKLNIQELLYIVILNEIFQRSFEEVEDNLNRIKTEGGESFVNKFVCYLKAPILTYSQHQEVGEIVVPIDEVFHTDEDDTKNTVNGISQIHKALLNNINSKQIKSYFFIQETITRTALKYTEFLVKQKGTGTKEIITQDFVYLIQMSCSIERKLQEYAQDMLADFIRYFPFACFSPDVMMAFSEAITFLFQKIGKEFDSKSHVMNSKHLRQQTLLHTDSKILTKTVVFLMNCVIKLIFRGLYIDHNFMKVLLLHLIKQETSLMSQLPFGYRFLKYVITSFRIDKEAIEAFKNEADRYNPYFWLTREVEFDYKLDSRDLSQFFSDKGLMKLQKLRLNQRIAQNTAQDILKTIELSIKNEIELEFQLNDQELKNQTMKVTSENILAQCQIVMQKIRQYCVEINLCQYFENNKASTNSKLLHQLRDQAQEINIQLINLVQSNMQRNNDLGFQSELKSLKKQFITDMLSQVASLKSILSLKNQTYHGQIQTKSQIITQLFDICKQYLQPQLLKYILMRLLPFLHSISPNYFDSTFFFLLGEILNYTVYQINNLGNLKYDKKISGIKITINILKAQDVFQIRQNYFNPLIEFEIQEFSSSYKKIIENHFSNKEFPPLLSNLVNLAQISYYDTRWRSLCKIHYILIKFLNDNMQIHLVKNVKLSVIANILKLNFLTDKRVVEFLPLENVCQVLKACIEIIQLIKEFKEKFKQDKQVQVKAGERQSLHPYCQNMPINVLKFDIEGFYYKTLKFGLSHFAKNQTLFKEPLIAQCFNLQKLKKRHQLYAIVCKYLSKEKLHELTEESKITRLKRVKKRFNAVIFKAHRKEKFVLDQNESQNSKISRIGRASLALDGATYTRKFQADIGYQNQQIFALNIQQLNFSQSPLREESSLTGEFQNLNVRPYYLRKALLLLMCDELDKIKAFAFTKLNEELSNEFSLLTQAKISPDFLTQIISEIPEKNLNLAYYIILKLYPLLNNMDTVEQALYKFLGEKVTVNSSQYMDCAHFFDIFLNHNKDQATQDNFIQLVFWRPPHIQILLKYITNTYENHPEVQLCFCKIMKRLHSEQIIFYLPQIVQSLGSRQGQLIKQFLIDFASQSVLFSHQLIWLAKVECKIDPDHKRPPSPKNLADSYDVLVSDEYQRQLHLMKQNGEVPLNQQIIAEATPAIIKKVIRNMDIEQSAFFKKLNGFFERVTAISGILKPQMLKPEKRDIIARELAQIEVSPDIYMPTNPRFQITGIKLDSGQPMQSAAKCPILVSFYCKKYEGPDKYFEKKLKIKKEIMQKMTEALDLNQVSPQRSPAASDWEIADEHFSDEEDRAVTFINQLVRPLLQKKNGGIPKLETQLSNSIQLPLSINQQQDRGARKDSVYFTFKERESLSLSSSQQFIRSLKRRQSAEEVVVELKVQRKKIAEDTQIKFEKSQQSKDQPSAVELKSCIFKVFDDIRQDNLALQIIQMFKGIFERIGLDLYVFPYKAISNRTGQLLNVGGIIEVIPNSISRDQMGKTNRCSLYEYFINKFGLPDTMNYQVARENFIKSQAAYSVISYILQIKDRHNGNILISDKGNLIHIDFGYIFDISPGHNLRFESANFKLTREMIMIMGGSSDSEAFKYYIDLTIRAFLAVRRYYEHMLNLVKLMLNSGLKCFRKDSLKNFTERFQLKKNDLAAAKYMKEIIMDAYDKMTTRLYDDIQFLQNGISR